MLVPIFPFCNVAFPSGILPPPLSPDVGADVAEDEKKTASLIRALMSVLILVQNGNGTVIADQVHTFGVA